MVSNNVLLAIRKHCFPQQLAFINDKSKRKALFVGRRAGKSTAIGVYFLLAALTNPGVSILYFGLTSGSAENTMFPILLGKENGIIPQHLSEKDYKYNNNEKLIEFSNGASIKFAGLDVSYKEVGKILGSKRYMVCVDECQNQTQDLKKMVQKDIGPCVSDYLDKGGGQIILAGTAGDFMGSNYWFQVNEQQPIIGITENLGWSIHHWEHDDNPHMAKQKRIEQDNFLAEFGPTYIEEDFWLQQYLCKWIISKTRLAFHFSNANFLGHPDCQTIKPAQHFFDHATGAIYGLGMDWGFSPDPMTFLVVCYNLTYSNKLFILNEHMQNEMYVPDIHEHIKLLDRRYHFQFMVADAGSQAKAQVEDLNNNYGWSIHYAEKLGKNAHINTLNGDLRAGTVLIDNCPILKDEMSKMIWDPVKLNTENRREFKSGLSDHMLDAMVYAHHYCRPHWYKAPKPKALPPTIEQQNYELAKLLIDRNKPRPMIQGGYLPSSVAGIDFSKAGYKPGKHR
jgi:hypothetical protein